MANEEFFNFEEALDQLRLKEEELKRLVSEGEIRAFREGDTMRLRRSDVEHLKRELMGGDVVELGDDELVFEDDVELGEAGMGTEEIANMDTMLDDDVEDVGEIDLQEEETVAREVVPAVPLGARRSTTTAVVETRSEGMLVRIVLVATALVLILGLPVVVSITKDHAGEMARMVAGLFGQNV